MSQKPKGLSHLPVMEKGKGWPVTCVFTLVMICISEKKWEAYCKSVGILHSIFGGQMNN